MLPKETIHIVNGKQLSNRQYADYREGIGYGKGKQAGIREAVEWLRNCELYLPFDQEPIKSKLKEWGIDG